MPEARLPRVSVIMPAHNAAATIGRALDCVRQQTVGEWEAIVADDHSTDATAAIARDYSARDARIRVVDSPGHGASAARNAALVVARGEWILFLDADDWVETDMLAASLRVLAESAPADMVAWGWQRQDAAGLVLQAGTSRFGRDPFEACARGCPVTIHSVLTRHALIREAGGFDESLRTCEDWDLWLRLARMGLRVIERPEVKAFYLTTPNSLSTRAALLRRDGERVIDRAHSADPRVTRPRQDLSQGRPARERAMRLHEWCAWVAGEAVGANMRAGDVLALIGDLPPALPDAWRFADFLEWSFVSGLALPVSGLAERWHALYPTLRDILAAWPSVASPGFATRVLRAVESRIAHSAPPGDLDLQVTVRRRVAIDRPLSPLAVPDGVQVVVVELQYDGTALGKIVAPAVDGVVAAATIADLAASQHWWALLRRCFERSVYPALQLKNLGDGSVQVVRGRTPLATAPTELQGTALHDLVGWTVLLQEVWARPTASLGDFYRRGSLLRYRPHARQAAITDALGVELGRQAVRDGIIGVAADDPRPLGVRLAAQRDRWQAEAHRPVRVTPEAVPRVASGNSATAAGRAPFGRHHFESLFAKGRDPWLYDSAYEARKYDQTLALALERAPRTALELACAEGHFTVRLAPHVERLVGADISALALERAQERCQEYPQAEFRQLDLFTGEIEGRYDLVTCCEVLYYAPSRDALRAVGARVAAAVAAGGRLVTAHANLLVDDPAEPGFDWAMPFGARVIAEELSRVRGLSLVKELRTPYYRISVFERGDDDAGLARASRGRPAPQVIVGDAVAPISEVARHFRHGGPRPAVADIPITTSRLPILMYHSVAADGPEAAARWRITPDRFAEQMHYLRDAGYRTVSLSEWARAMRRRQPIPGRCVALTFDDGFADFATQAWPVMRALGQMATVFVVTGQVGGGNVWDRAIAAPAPLLDATTIRQLHREGVEFGSHTVTHPFLTGLDGASAARELGDSRAALGALIGTEVEALAYPYGDADWATMALAGAAGYRYALSCKGSAASLAAPPYDLPRIEVSGDLSFAQFVAALDL